jgi:hypothetical protein
LNRLLLWDCDPRAYSYYIETSVDNVNWVMAADKRNELCRSWQILLISPPRPVSFIRITGTHNSVNEVFHCVHFECPCDGIVLQRFLELEKETKLKLEEERKQKMLQQQEQQQLLLQTDTTIVTSINETIQNNENINSS